MVTIYKRLWCESRTTVFVLDEKDRVIIETLEKNARTPFTELARILGISEAAVRKRVENLQKRGIIEKYTIKVDPSKMGYENVTILGLDVEPQHFLEATRKLAKIDEIRWLVTSTGDHMIMAEIWAKDSNELSKIITEKIGGIQGVKKICPAIILKRVK
ncbi:MAG: transcriptional regulator [Methanobacteriota archaeon]|nr:MAG: transcriptional regulator [Euryarchaeota archaeon]